MMAGCRSLLLLVLLSGSTFGNASSSAPTNTSCLSPVFGSGELCNGSAIHALSRNSTNSTSILHGTRTSNFKSPLSVFLTDARTTSIPTSIESALAEPTSYNLIPASIQSSPTYEATNISSAAPNISFPRLPSHNGTAHSPFSNNSMPVSHAATNISLPHLNSSLLRAPWQNVSSYPAFQNDTSIPAPNNASDLVPIELQIHRSNENSDLYPPKNLSSAYHCAFNKTSKSALGTGGLRLTRRQARNSSDLYPPGWSPCAQRDADFFEFTEENIRESGVIIWYARWTVEARDRKPKEFTQRGEWRMFYSWWLQEHNFRCGYDFSNCKNAKSRQEVQAIYPGEQNRELVRRIYFVTMMYDYLHDHTRMMQDVFKDLHVDLSGHFSSLIGSFTQHGNEHGRRLCDQYKLWIQTTVNIGMGMLNAVVMGVPAAFSPVIKGIAKEVEAAAVQEVAVLGNIAVTEQAATLGETAMMSGEVAALEEAAVAGEPALAGEIASSEEATALGQAEAVKGEVTTSSKTEPEEPTVSGAFKKLGADVKAQLFGQAVFDIEFVSIFNWQTWQQLAEDRMYMKRPIIATGMGKGWGGMCASVEGDFQDQSAFNLDTLQRSVSENYQHVREAVYATFRDVYTGTIEPHPGIPSYMAAIMAHRKWAGDDSILSDIDDSTSMSRVIRTSAVKQLISKLLSDSQNFMKCTHADNAPKMCENAKKQRELGAQGYDVDKSRFCPHPDTDPAYICEVGSWYFAERDQHQRTMSGLGSLEYFWNNEFNFTLLGFMEEVHENYERCHNNCTQMNLDRLVFDPDGIAAQGFAIPVCSSDNVKLSDFLKKKKSNRQHFPSFCGNFAANESEGFMKAANMGKDSQVANTVAVQGLWADIIYDELNGLRPYSRYMGLCANGVSNNHWDQHGRGYTNKHMTYGSNGVPNLHERNPHCDWVETNTRGMEEFEANHFFCESKYVWDHIFKDWTAFNVKYACKKWMKKHGGVKRPHRI